MEVVERKGIKDVTLFPISLVCWHKREKNGLDIAKTGGSKE